MEKRTVIYKYTAYNDTRMSPKKQKSHIKNEIPNTQH